MEEYIVRLKGFIHSRWFNEDAISFIANYMLIEAGYRNVYTADCSYILKDIPPNTIVINRTIYVGKKEDILKYISSNLEERGRILKYLDPGISSKHLINLSYWVNFHGVYVNIYGQKISELDIDKIEHDVENIQRILNVPTFIVVYD